MQFIVLLAVSKFAQIIIVFELVQLWRYSGFAWKVEVMVTD
jgi:hypothetical protein